jgi:hypothetical protein
MYQRTGRFTIGSGDATGLIQRLHDDLLPLIEAASGFIAYTAVKIDDQTVITTRLFRDLASMDAESQSTSQTGDAIANDFQVTLDPIVDSDAGIGAASVLTEEFLP